MVTVEIPLDPEYLTTDGFYMAGYLWGSHVRAPESLSGEEKTMADQYPEFLQGVKDGYGDALAKWETLAKPDALQEEPEDTLKIDQVQKAILENLDLIEEIMKKANNAELDKRKR